jgi:hypothetical protein
VGLASGLIRTTGRVALRPVEREMRRGLRSGLRSARYSPASVAGGGPAAARHVHEPVPDQAEIAAIFAELDEQVRQGY